MLKRGRDYRETYDGFRWEVPRLYNIGVDVCDRHAAGASRTALIYHDQATDAVVEYSFRQLRGLSNRLANALAGLGIGRGDRVGIVLPQRPETAVAHLAAYKLGAIAVPMSCLFGPDALEYRLRHSAASLVVVDDDSLPRVESILDRLPSLRHVVVASSRRYGGAHSFDDLLERGAERFVPAATHADDPALLIYTSGTTGPPKGALHAHRTLLGHLPGVEFSNNFLPQPGDRFWSPADWAWIAGLMDVLLPAWHHGLPVVVDPAGKFDPERAFDLMARHSVRNTLIPPSALKMMRDVPEPRQRYGFELRTVSSGGEPLGSEVLEWAKDGLGVTINEVYGQTEANLVVGSCHEVMAIKPGSMGRPMPGHEVAVIRSDGSRAPAGEIGEIAVKRPDPVMILEYWNHPQATEDRVHRRLGPHGRHGQSGRRRLLLVHRPKGRPDNQQQLQDRPVRGRGLDTQTPGGVDGRRCRRTRRDAGGDRQGFREAQAGRRGVTGARRGHPGDRQGKPERPRVSPGGRVCRFATYDHDGKDHPPGAAGQGEEPARTPRLGLASVDNAARLELRPLELAGRPELHR